MRRGRPRHDDVLTPREWEVLALLRQSLTNDQIAGQLAISANTVKFHVWEIPTKLGVSSREEAAAWQPVRRRWLASALALPFRSSFAAGAKLAAAGVVGVATIGFGLLALGVVLSHDGVDVVVAGPLGKIAY